jgi:type III secretion protein V
VILEALVEWGARESDTLVLTERVRVALARQICHRHAQLNRVVAAYVLTRNAEETVRSAIKATGVGKMLALPEDASRAMLSQLRQELEESEEHRNAVLLTSLDIRRVMRNFLQRNEIDIPVLSYQEIAPEYSVQSLMSVTINSQTKNRPIKSMQAEENVKTDKGALTIG